MLKAHSSDLLEAPKQDFKQDIRAYFDRIAPELDRWSRRNRYYYSDLVRLHQFIIPSGSRVLEIGCGTGDLLQATAPALGVGLEYGLLTGLAVGAGHNNKFRKLWDCD